MTTVFALSSARGRAGVAVVRISGSCVKDTLAQVAALSDPKPRAAQRVAIRDPRTDEVLDQGLAIFFPGPKSFTGEDVCELHIHGGPAVVNSVLDCLTHVPGLYPAEAGDFTRRAFDNGKLDLSEVEGLADLIAAETEAQRRQALRQMQGALSALVESWRESLLKASALCEALIDFSDEELPDDLSDALDHNILTVKNDLAQYIDGRHLGERLRDGFQIAIIGPPNAGKSSLLNALVRREAAIVTDIAGTTRDVVEVHLDLEGYPVLLADTAGLRRLEGEDVDPSLRIELEGMMRSRKRAEDADLVLVVFDAAESVPASDEAWSRLGSRAIVIWNKVDLRGQKDGSDGEPKPPEELRDLPAFMISAKSGIGLPDLLDHLRGEVVSRFGGGEAAVVTRLRHRQALEETVSALDRMRSAPLPELAAEDLRVALSALGRITGRNDIEDVLDLLFSEFCIGK